jgi:hypothetical protein
LVVAALVATVLLAVACLTLANYRFSAANPGGNDFIPRWLGTRLLLLNGQSPYSEESTLAIQQAIYGRPATGTEDQVLFVYPLYACILFAPFALIGDYVLARALWMTTLEVALLLLTAIGLRLAGWRPASPGLILILLFSLTWYHGARPLINGNPSILMAFLVCAALLALKSRRDVLAGLLLALATIKPQALILLLPLILAWAIVKRRTALLVSALSALAGLVLLAVLINPAWLIEDLRQITAYPDYTLAGTPGDIFRQWWPGAGSWPGVGMSLVIVILLAWQWRDAFSGEFEVLLPVAYFTLAATNLTGITTAVSNYIALLPGLILLLGYLRRERGRFRDWPALLLLTMLWFGLWVLFWISRTGRAQSPIMFFPLPILLIGTLPFVAHAARKARPSTSP